MKVRKLAWPIFSLCVVLTAGLTACEEKTGEEGGEPKQEAPAAPAEGGKPGEAAPAKEAAAPKEPPVPPPAEVCTSLVNAIKAKDEAKVLTMSTDTTPAALGAEGAKDHVMTTLAGAACGAAKVEGENATVAVTAGDVSQDVPFVLKAKEGWKFDGASYLAKYPPPPADKHAKGKGKGKDHAKGKAGKGKHKKK